VSPVRFKLRAEHPERQHIPDNVSETAVEEQVGDQFPYRKHLHDGSGNQFEKAERSVQSNEEGKNEYGSIADQQSLHTFGKAGGGEDAQTAGSSAVSHGKRGRLYFQNIIVGLCQRVLRICSGGRIGVIIGGAVHHGPGHFQAKSQYHPNLPVRKKPI